VGALGLAATANVDQDPIGGVGLVGGADATEMTMMKDQVTAAVGADKVQFRLFPASALGSWSEMAEQGQRRRIGMFL
jgi:hypothetical protein